MTDFDRVLERLLGDASFAAALASNPTGALAGYQLSDDEVALLHSQVSRDPGADGTVEMRTNQSSVFGLISPLTSLAGLGEPPATAGIGAAAGAGFGAAAPAVEGFGGPALDGTGGTGGMGPGEGLGGALQQLGAAQLPPAGGVGPAEGFGPAATPPDGFDPMVGGPGPTGGLAGLGDLIGTDLRMAGGAELPGLGGDTGFGTAEHPVPKGYDATPDVNGDGAWDRYTAVGRADGGVDLHVDLNRDGQVDWIGHDDDADGMVETAEYDKNYDGFFEKTMYDDDNDGWLDRTVRHERPDDDDEIGQPMTGLGERDGPTGS